jgi:glycosyltransferase involved in cell wall biosynthesis
MKQPLRIGVVMQGGHGWTGGTEYIKNLALALGALPPEERSTFQLSLVFGRKPESGVLDQLRGHLDATYELHAGRFAGLVQRLGHWAAAAVGNPMNACFEKLLKSARLDFIYPLTYDNRYNLGVSLPRRGNFLPCAWAGWIPDFQHRRLPEFFNDGEIDAREKGISRLLACARTLVLSSKSALADLKRFFPRADVRTEVLSFATYPNPQWFESDPREAQAKYNLPERYLLVSNQFWRHKNHLIIFEALSLLRKQSPFPNIVCTGQLHDFRDKEYANTVLQRIHTLGVAGQVLILGLIPRLEQIQLMRGALAVIQPSLFEGWSTVVEDARVLGAPLILSDLDVHREQNPPDACFFDPHSADSLAERIAEVWQSEEKRHSIDKEPAARSAGIDRSRAFGRRFLEIAHAAMEPRCKRR